MTSLTATSAARPVGTTATTTQNQRVMARKPAGPVTIIESFHLPPRGERAWQEQWEEVRQLAAQFAGCRRFELLRDRKDRRRYSVLTEWESMESYNRFRLQTGVVWIERMRPAAFHPTRSSSFDQI